MLGISKVAKDSWLNNQTPMVNIDLGIVGKSSIDGERDGERDKNAKTSTILFQMSALCGYTFKPITNLYLTPAAGLGFSVGSVKVSSTVIIDEYTGEKYT